MGDYNAVLNIDDRIYGNHVQETEVKDFRELLDDTSMAELKIVGRKFTWTNNHIYSRIDRALVNAEWLLKFPQLNIQIMDPHFSDHSPLCLNVEVKSKMKPIPFRFFNYVAEHKEFLTVVKVGWAKRAQGNQMEKILAKLKEVK
ncbi:uncharacterized protein [Nicotiana tomentosiformis]|uniref:uncharacterized protein n=1 Tax=Nicotiana tomentosiformis TaxID=4098 RepID=UPI00388C4D0C